MSPRRWFRPEAVEPAIRSLVEHSRAPFEERSVTPSREKAEMVRNVALAAGGVLVFILVLVLVLGAFAERKDPDWKPTLEKFLFPALLVLGAGAAAWYMTVQSQERRRGSDRAFGEIASRGDHLNAIGGRRLVGSDVGTFPWFATEEHVSDEQMNVCIYLAGKYAQQELVYVECTHVVDPMSGLPSLTRSLGSLAVSRMKRLALRGMDAAIFLARLTDLPDLLIVPNSDPTAGQYLAVVGNAAHELARTSNVPPEIHHKYWLATSEPHWLGPLFTDRLTSLLSGRDWCLIQIIGGYCVVMTRWLRKSTFSHPERKERQITADLDFATAVFAELRRYGSHETDMASPPAARQSDAPQTPRQESLRARDESPGAPLDAAAPIVKPSPPPAEWPTPPLDRHRPGEPMQQAPAAPPQPAGSYLRVLAKVCGGFVGTLATFLGIFTMGMYGPDLFWGTGSEDWPTVQGTVVKASFEEKQFGSSVFFSPEFSYTYDVEGKTHSSDRIQFGFHRAETRELADELIAAYPEGKEAPVHYNPNRHGMGTLRVGLFKPEVVYVGLGFGTCILLFGLVTIWFSLPARKRKPTA